MFDDRDIIDLFKNLGYNVEVEFKDRSKSGHPQWYVWLRDDDFILGHGKSIKEALFDCFGSARTSSWGYRLCLTYDEFLVMNKVMVKFKNDERCKHNFIKIMEMYLLDEVD